MIMPKYALLKWLINFKMKAITWYILRILGNVICLTIKYYPFVPFNGVPLYIGNKKRPSRYSHVQIHGINCTPFGNLMDVALAVN